MKAFVLTSERHEQFECALREELCHRTCIVSTCCIAVYDELRARGNLSRAQLWEHVSQNRTVLMCRAGENRDRADGTENGRIRLGIDAGSWRTVNEWERPPRRLLRPGRPFPKNLGSWREAVPNAIDPASSASSAKSSFPQAAAR